MKSITTTTNYLIIDNEGVKYVFPKNNSDYLESYNSITIRTRVGIPQEFLISFKEVGSWVGEDLSTPLTETTLRTLVQLNTGFNTASGGSGAVLTQDSISNLGFYTIQEVNQLLDNLGVVDTTPEEPKTVVFVTASIGASVFQSDLTTPHAGMMSALQANGVDNITVYGYGLSGATLETGLTRINEALDAHPDAIIITHLGGNNVSEIRPLSTASAAEITDFENAFQAIQDRFTGIEDQLIMLPLTFRSYADNSIDDSMYLDGSTGSQPFNEQYYLPALQSDQKNTDGNALIDWFGWTQFNRLTALDTDGIHLTSSGVSGLLQYTADVLDYAINRNGTPPSVIPHAESEDEEEPPVTGTPIDTGRTVIVGLGLDSAQVGFNNYSNLDFGTDLSLLDILGDSTGLTLNVTGTGTINNNPNGLNFGSATFDNTLENNPIYNSSLYSDSNNSLTHIIEGFTPNATYTMSFCGSRTTTEDRVTQIDANGSVVSYNTSSNPPEAPVSTNVVADSNGRITLEQTNLSGSFNYLGGIQITL